MRWWADGICFDHHSDVEWFNGLCREAYQNRQGHSYDGVTEKDSYYVPHGSALLKEVCRLVYEEVQEVSA